MKRCVLVLLVLLARPVAGRLGGDLRRGRVPRARRRRAQRLVDVRDLQRRRPGCAVRGALRAQPARRRTCLSGAGVTFNSLPAKQTVKVDDGAAWVFRAPPGRSSSACRSGATPPRLRAPTTPRTAASRTAGGPCSPARATGRGARRARGRDLPGQRADRARHHLLPQGRRGLPRHDSGQLRHRRARRQLGRPVHRAADHLAVLHRRRHEGHAHLHLQAAVVTVDDPVAPAAASGVPGDGVRRTNEIFTAAATDSAGVRSLRVLVDGVARVDETYTATSVSPRPAPPRARATSTSPASPTAATRVTTIAEDAASNVTRTEQVIDVDGTAARRRPRAGQRAHASPCSSPTPAPGSRAARSRSATAPTKPFIAAEDHPARRAPDRPPCRARSRCPASASASRSPTAPATPSASVVTSMSLSTRIGKAQVAQGAQRARERRLRPCRHRPRDA